MNSLDSHHVLLLKNLSIEKDVLQGLKIRHPPDDLFLILGMLEQSPAQLAFRLE